MSTFRGVRAAVVALVLAASAGVTLAPPAAADAPVVQDDHKWMYPGQLRSIDVLANDSDPDGDDLAVCRIEEPPGDADYFVDIDGDEIFVFAGEDTGEDIVIHYYVCDFETLVPATLTISFRDLHPIKVGKVDRPGRLRVTNDNNRAVRFLYGSFRQDRPDGRARVPAHDSVVIRVHRHKIDWIAILGRSVFVGSGSVRGIELPDRASQTDRATITLTRAEARLWDKQR